MNTMGMWGRSESFFVPNRVHTLNFCDKRPLLSENYIKRIEFEIILFVLSLELVFLRSPSYRRVIQTKTLKPIV